MYRSAAGVVCILGSSMAQASMLAPDTTYNMSIRTGTSCYTAGNCSEYLNGFTDNGGTVTFNGTTYGSAIAGDGLAGIVRFRTDASGQSYTVLSYNLDQYPFGPPDAFVTWSDSPGLMTGTIDASGHMIFTPTGRLATSGFFPSIGIQPWNIDDSSAIPAASGDWTSLTTGMSTAQDPSCDQPCDPSFSLTGSPLTPDGSGGWNAVLVSASNFGDSWAYFSGTPYSEVWDVNIQAVPIPASVWLLGSGCLALLGVARRGTGRSGTGG